LIISVPGRKPAVCSSLVELIDLYPTVSRLCGLPAVNGLQGKDLAPVFDDPKQAVRETAFCVAPSRNGFLLRDDQWAYIQYGEDAAQGIELFDVVADPRQNTNLANKPEMAAVVKRFQSAMTDKLRTLRENNLPLRRS